MQRDVKAHEGCQLHTLAQGSVGHVQRCSHCDALSLHLGAVTLRFDAAALESLWNVIGKALGRLQEDAQVDRPPRLHMQRPAGRA